MKKVFILFLMVCAIMGAGSDSSAVDFKVRGEWLAGFAVFDANLIREYRDGKETIKPYADKFGAIQRVRLQLAAAASENLSGTVFFEIGNQNWGRARNGAALGADGENIIKIKQAFMDWRLPDSDFTVNMGIIDLYLPNTAGGSAIMDTDVAGINASYKFNDKIALTGLWLRPLNDNFTGSDSAPAGYLDNIDLFALILPINLQGFDLKPWIMYGIKGRNSMKGINGHEGFHDGFYTSEGNLPYSLYPYPGINGWKDMPNSGKIYGSMFWAGLPLIAAVFEPWRFELDLNYGYVEEMGRYWAVNVWENTRKHASTRREGWLARARLEYKFDWGVPGILGWYGSGDDGNPKNGSERMPSIVTKNLFTAFLGDSNLGWHDYALDYAGTWGAGIQLRDVSFIDDLKHTFRAVYWGGTNSPAMVKYMEKAYSWNDGWASGTSPYLTTNDGLLELNFISIYKLYENFEVNLQMAYVANFIDNKTWKKAGAHDSSFSRQDAWESQLFFNYSF